VTLQETAAYPWQRWHIFYAITGLNSTCPEGFSKVSTLIRFHQTIWRKYAGWLRTVTSTIPSEEIVKTVIQQEYYHNFRFFRNTAIYRIIMSKNKKRPTDPLLLAA